ncbi:hypothetical protein EIP91_009107 [Steccherinum ochraceum]|uniref:DUF6534 domain-containing protein n=1 Tax=Steccherinum ochraceum TaxID=92696 RepID=A0A4R0S030_9APHY|nr:hypothetical protein EIP91_009107 [Steccherinum ochraceum]
MATSLGPTYGAALVGIVIEGTLFGVTLLQTYEYYKSYPSDSIRLKSLVAVLTVLDTLHLILCARTLYWYLISSFGQFDVLDQITWSMALQTDCNGLIGVAVQLFFARRLWMMSRNWILTILISILGTIHFALGVVFTVQSFILGRFSAFASLTWVTCTGLGSAAAGDILIALSMVYYLQKKRTGIQSTDSIVTTLMLYSINTGLLTSILATASVILFAIMPTNFIWLAFFWIMGKCYVNSLLASLNSRESLRNKVHSSSAVEMSRFRKDSSMLGKKQTHSGALAVAIETTTEYRTDFDSSHKSASPEYKRQWSPTSSAIEVIEKDRLGVVAL